MKIQAKAFVEMDKFYDKLVINETEPVYDLIVDEASGRYRQYSHWSAFHDVVSSIDRSLSPRGYELANVSAKFDDGNYYSKEGVSYKTPAARMFATIALSHYDRPNSDNNLMIGFRNSIDKSMSFGIASGAQVIVCSNMCISGSSVTILKKHTKNNIADVMDTIDMAVFKSEGNYESMANFLYELSTKEISNDYAYAALGRMNGHNIIKPQQYSNALKIFKNPTHREYGFGTMNTLYQALTEAVSDDKAIRVLETSSKVTDFIRNEYRNERWLQSTH